MTNEVDDPIEVELLKAQNDIQIKRELWASVKEVYSPLVKRLQELEVRVGLSSDIDLSFSGDKAKLTQVIRLLRTNGFSTRDDLPEANKSYWHARFRHSEHKLPFWVSFSSTVCRQVPIGTRMVEETVYEVRCD
jgi:hypothetical protein